ncbi:hypothetical protein UT300012_24510 [Paraclostridium bifermentans]
MKCVVSVIDRFISCVFTVGIVSAPVTLISGITLVVADINFVYLDIIEVVAKSSLTMVALAFMIVIGYALFCEQD